MSDFQTPPPVEFLIELPSTIDPQEVERLKKALAEDGELEAFKRESRDGAEIVRLILEVALATGTGIDIVTKGIEVVDQKKKALDKAAKIVQTWLHSGDKKGKSQGARLVSPDSKDELTKVEGPSEE